jgi:hypothetical protein
MDDLPAGVRYELVYEYEISSELEAELSYGSVAAGEGYLISAVGDLG